MKAVIRVLFCEELELEERAVYRQQVGLTEEEKEKKDSRPGYWVVIQLNREREGVAVSWSAYCSWSFKNCRSVPDNPVSSVGKPCGILSALRCLVDKLYAFVQICCMSDVVESDT